MFKVPGGLVFGVFHFQMNSVNHFWDNKHILSTVSKEIKMDLLNRSLSQPWTTATTICLSDTTPNAATWITCAYVNVNSTVLTQIKGTGG